jgi:hypothetical protein
VCSECAIAADDLLARTGKQEASFLDQFSQLHCTEEVTQTKLVKNLSKQGVEYSEQQTFDYLVIALGSGDDLAIQESRLAKHTAEHKKKVPLLVTNGFATLSLVFHPRYESSFSFSAPENERLNGRMLAKVNFQHVKGKPTPTALLLRGQEYPLELKGTAWIDPQTATIVRLQAELQEDMSDVGLRTFNTELEYAPVHFRGVTSDYWLPAQATIELATPKQRWRNIHRFTKYEQFSVTTDESVKVQ